MRLALNLGRLGDWRLIGISSRQEPVKSSLPFGIVCPECGLIGSSVTDSRQQSQTVYRRRKCDVCGETFGTVEIVLDDKSEI